MKRIDLIVNRLRVDMVKRGEMMTVDDVTDILAVNLIVPCRMMSRSLFPQTVVSHWLEPTVWQESIFQYLPPYYGRRSSIPESE